MQPATKRLDYKPKSLKPLREAQKALRLLYDWKQTHLNERPTSEQFYPIDLDCLVSLLGWKLERVTSVAAYLESNEPVDAHTDFEKKEITLAVSDNIPKGRLNYSLAHEIGHVMLHGEEGIKLMDRTRCSIRERRSKLRYPHNYDVEADRFAAELLMPSRAVQVRFQQLFGSSEIIVGSSLAYRFVEKHRFGQVPKEISDRESLSITVAKNSLDPKKESLAYFFGVSHQTMAYRLIELQLVLS